MVRIRTTFLLIAFVLTGAAPALAAPESRRMPVQPSAPRAAAWDRLRTSSLGADASILWSAVDDVPISVRAGGGAGSLPGWGRDRAAAVVGLIREHADLFRLGPGDAFHAVDERERNGIHHLRMVQSWRGIPVRGGQYRVSVGTDGRLRMMSGRSVPNVDADASPVLAPVQAIAAAARSRGRSPGRDSITTRLAIEPREGRDRLVYEVRLVSRGRPEAWEILVDAQDGTIAGTRDLGFGASGCASVWNPSPQHPLIGEDFVIAQPVDGVARLEGTHVRVFQETETGPVALTSTRHDSTGCFDFRFDPVTQPEAFDQANVYWHVDHFLREFHGGNGFAGLPAPITVLLSAFQCGDANTGLTIGTTVYLTSEGCGYRSSTRDADIICHETQHALSNALGLEGGTDRDREIYATALHEAYANYFACAAQNDPIYAEYFFGPQGFANCNSSPSEYHYSRIDEISVGTLQNYLIGMIWSGALWDIRSAIGPIIDRIALESFHYLPAQPTMYEAREAILQADLDLHGGAHQAAMKAAFDARGLVPRQPVPSIAGPRERFKGEAGHWSASACCATPPYRFEWSRLRTGATVPEPLGTDVAVTVTDTASFDLILKVTDAADQVRDTTLHVGVIPLTMTVRIHGPTRILPDTWAEWTAEASAPRYVPVSIRWVVACVPDTCFPSTVERSVLVARLHETSRVSAIVTALGVSFTQTAEVLVDAIPVVTILGAPASLPPGVPQWVTAYISGGLSPYAITWMKNGTTPECVIGRTPSVEVIGDNVETDLYLQVITALGLKSNLAKVTIAPLGVPLHAAIDGPSIVTLVEPGRWFARIEGGPPPSATYRWTRTCLDPGCEPVTIGADSTLLFWFSQNFDLGLTVSTTTRTASVMRRIRMHGVPTATLIDPPEWVAPGEPVTFRAQASNGAEPYSYRWTRNGLTDEIGRGPTLSLRGDGTDFELFLTVTSSTGFRSELVRHTVHSGLGGRPIPDRAALRIDRAVVREGAELIITLEGRPGSSADLRLLDIAGREVARLFGDALPVGVQFLSWNSGQVRSGVYVLRAVIGNERITRRLNVVR